MPRERFNVVYPLDKVFRMKVGAVVVKKMEDIWYFAYFESLSRPHRGFQVVRGGVDPGEHIEDALIRELAEEYTRPVRVMGTLALNYYKDTRNTDVQVYYLAEDLEEAHPKHVWTVIDGDAAAQELVWRFAPLHGDISFLSRGHADIVAQARARLLT